MKVLNKKIIIEFYEKHTDVREYLLSWIAELEDADWDTPIELKERYPSASILKNNRVVFNIAGNKYRLIVSIDYIRQACFVKFVGTHQQYDQIDAENYDGYSPNKN